MRMIRSKFEIAILLFLCIKPFEINAESTSTLIFNITCDPHDKDSQNCPSESLETIAAVAKEYTDIQVNIKIPQLKVIADVKFTNLNSLTIVGEPNMTSIICMASGSHVSSVGMALRNIMSMVILKSLNLISCGSQTNDIQTTTTYSSALIILQCKNVELSRVVIANSKGIGMTILEPQGGRVSILSTVFKENKLPQEYQAESILGGGGVFIVLYQNQPAPMSFIFDNCTFANNTAHTIEFDFGYTNDIGEFEKGYGSGGGVHLSIKNGLSNVDITFSGCNFIANQAFSGGGITVRVYDTKHDEIRNVTLEIRNSLFAQNGCDHAQNAYFGGGAHLSFVTDFEEAVITDSHYLVRNVSFIENCAELGGGVFYYSGRSKQGFNDNMDNSMVFDNCTFKCNQAHIGSAVDLAPSMFFKLVTGFTIDPIFKNCRFLENIIFVNKSQFQKTTGIGTIYGSFYNIHFDGSNCFENNKGTPVYLVNGVANFTNSNTSFINNTSLQGGAIALIGSSLMIVGPNRYKFVNNTAAHKGGAIYVLLTDSTDFITSRSCFIQYMDTDSVPLSINWKSNITFIGNKAVDDAAGHAIYATSLHPCQVINNGTLRKPKYTLLTNISDIFTIRGISFDGDPRRPQIATDGALFNIAAGKRNLTVIPGERYRHGVTLIDDLGQAVNASLRVAISRKYKDVELNSGFYTFTGSDIQLRGKPNHNASLFMYTVSPKQSYIKLNVDLIPCPPGYKLSEKTLMCECNTDAYIGLYRCDLVSFNCHLHLGYWVGLMKNQNGSPVLVTSPCPFCDYHHSVAKTNSPGLESVTVVLPQKYSELSETVCGKKRTGIVCSKCQENYTMHFHSPGFHCKHIKPAECKLGWLFYILSELVPITIFFLTVLCLNISFTSGAVNGFILFSQLIYTLDIDASGIIVLPSPVRQKTNGWKEAYQVIYGVFNLDFFTSESLSFCLWKSASALDMLAIKYVTILYTLVLIMAVVWVMNSCGGKCCGRCCRITTVKTSVIHGISTFLVMCYAQCIKVSLYLLTPVHFYADEDAGLTPRAHLWLNGEVTYFSKHHLLYALPALLCLFSIGLFPLVLLSMYPLLSKALTLFGCENLRAVHFISQIAPIGRFKPLLDSIQGCFKDNFRFFAGLYFLYRWIILLILTCSTTFTIYYTVVSAVSLLFLTIHAICQPYIKGIHNIIDALLFTNLSLITFLASLNYQTTRGHKKMVRGCVVPTSIIQLVLIYLPLVVMGVYVLLALRKKIGVCSSTCLMACFTALFIPKRACRLRELLQRPGRDDEDAREQLLDNTMDFPRYT